MSANDFYAQQRVRLAIGYDLSSDLTFYVEIQDSATWGANGVDMVVLHNEIRAIPSMIVEPYYVLYHNNRLSERANPDQVGPKSSSQVRHMIGARAELRRGNWDFVQEVASQFGREADGAGTTTATVFGSTPWASGTWLGYTCMNSTRNLEQPSDSTTPRGW